MAEGQQSVGDSPRSGSADGQMEAFRQAILESPEDESLRLVFADWLEERGDPLGEFIRVQCQLASASEWQKGRSRWEKREAALRREHAPRWAAPLPAWGWKFQFRRGFIHHVETSVDSFVEHAAELFDAHPVTSVKFTSFDGTDETLQKLLALPQLAKIRTLAIAPGSYLGAQERARGFDDPRAAMLLATESLRLTRLELFGHGLTSRVLQRLAQWKGLPTLESLSLGFFPATPEGIATLAAVPLERLNSFSMTRVRLERDGAAALATAVWPNLRELRLTLTRLGSFGARALADSSLLTNLSELSLPSNLMGIRGIEALAGAMTPRLRRLDVAANSSGEHQGKGVRALVETENARGLEFLGLRRNRIDDAGAGILARSPHLEGLRALDLRNNRLTPAGARSLAESTTLTNLRQLDLRNIWHRARDRNALRDELGRRFARL